MSYLQRPSQVYVYISNFGALANKLLLSRDFDDISYETWLLGLDLLVGLFCYKR